MFATYLPKIIFNLSCYVCNAARKDRKENTYAGRKASYEKTAFCESNKKKNSIHKYFINTLLNTFVWLCYVL